MSYIVGIDLGTTNSALAYVKREAARPRIRILRIPQLVAPGEVEKRDTLSSFHYTPQEGEFAEDVLRLPWEKSEQSFVVGHLAKEQGGKQPERLISSAKSWLSHTRVDRGAQILPWHGPAELERLSPAEVNARYLAHLTAAWNHEFPEHPLQKQTLIVTVPASYDEVARELTVEAARQAGLSKIVLLEEPQAALYHWLSRHEQDWRQMCQAGQTILVCDIGGGTSDFTLIAVENGDADDLRLQRVRVGEHLILGGDNLDLALAHYVEEQLAAPLPVRQWSILVRACQSAKETLLGPSAPDELSISLPQSGSSLLRNALQVSLERDAVRELLVEGFLPDADLSERPRSARSGFQEFGLNYASDPAMTRHLAAFLASEEEGEAVRPDYVLFNGGFFKSEALTERVFQHLCAWFGDTAGHPQPRRLDNPDVDLAVAYGAAYYGSIREGEGTRIHSELLRSYYIGVENEQQEEKQAICLIPAGLAEGKSLELVERSFKLRIRQPVEFPLFVSKSRPQDHPGDLVATTDDRIHPLPPIRTLLSSGKKKKSQEVDVRLHAALSEVGTLELWCKEMRGERSWKLEFNTRAAPEELEPPSDLKEEPVEILPGDLQRCEQLLERIFSSTRNSRPQNVLKDLEGLTGLDRYSWPLPFLRGLWEKLIELEAGRRLSAQHESFWLNALGFCLRPGYGFQMDDWRVQKSWSLLINTQILHKRNQACRAEWWILWRRIAGGLNANYQEALLQSCLPQISDSKGRLQQKSKVGKHEQAEMYRALGALEFLSPARKIALGDMLLQAIEKQGLTKGHNPLLWTLGHVGGRIPMYGTLDSVVPMNEIEQWLERLLALPDLGGEQSFPLMLMARKTGDRYRDIGPELRAAVLEKMSQIGPPEHYRSLIEEAGRLTDKEQRLAFGESLPSGLRLV